jgi:hypothetical protein
MSVEPLNVDPERIVKTRQKGFTDDEIVDAFIEKLPEHAERIKSAKQKGFSSKEIVNAFITESSKRRRKREDINTSERLGQIGLQQPIQTEEESRIEELITGTPGSRLVQQGALGLTEGSFGLPGNFASLAQTLTDILPESPSLLRGTAEQSPLMQKGRELLEKAPTSEDIRLQRAASRPETEPQGQFERNIRKGAEFVGNAIPLEGGAAEALPAFVSGYFQQEAEDAGFGPVGQIAVSLGAGILTGSIQNAVRRRGATKQIKDTLYRKANQSLPKGSVAFANELEEQVENLIVDLNKGTMTPNKRAVLKVAKDIKRKISGGVIEIVELTNFKRDINDLAFDKELKGAKKLFGALGSNVDTAIQKTRNNYPEFVNLYNRANLAHGAIESTKRLKDVIDPKSIFSTTSLLLGLVSKPLAIAVKGGQAALGIKDLAQKVLKSPDLRRMYTKIIKDGVRMNEVTLNKLVRDFDKELNKEE